MQAAPGIHDQSQKKKIQGKFGTGIPFDASFSRLSWPLSGEKAAINL
jgi:hypothetical protein